MPQNSIFKAFIAVLVTMIVILLISAWLAYNGKYAEALGIGGVLSGLLTVATLLARPNSPNGNTQADTNMATMIDKLPPATPGLTTSQQENRS